MSRCQQVNRLGGASPTGGDPARSRCASVSSDVAAIWACGCGPVVVGRCREMWPSRGAVDRERRKPRQSGAFVHAPKRTRTSTRLSRTRPSTLSVKQSGGAGPRSRANSRPAVGRFGPYLTLRRVSRGVSRNQWIARPVRRRRTSLGAIAATRSASTTPPRSPSSAARRASARDPRGRVRDMPPSQSHCGPLARAVTPSCAAAPRGRRRTAPPTRTRSAAMSTRMQYTQGDVFARDAGLDAGPCWQQPSASA